LNLFCVVKLKVPCYKSIQVLRSCQHRDSPKIIRTKNTTIHQAPQRIQTTLRRDSSTLLAVHTTHRLSGSVARRRSIRTRPPLPRINTPGTRRRSRRIPSQSPTVQQQTIKQKTSRRNRKHKQKLDQGIRGSSNHWNRQN